MFTCLLYIRPTRNTCMYVCVLVSIYTMINEHNDRVGVKFVMYINFETTNIMFNKAVLAVRAEEFNSK